MAETKNKNIGIMIAVAIIVIAAIVYFTQHFCEKCVAL